MTDAVNIKTLRDYLKAKLLKTNGLGEIKVWHNAKPTVFQSTPFGWVKAKGGPKTHSNNGCRRTINTFDIVIVTKDADIDKAEDTALAYMALIEKMIDADRNFDGKVADAWVSNREDLKDSETASWGKRTSFAAWKITVTSWKYN